FQLRNGKYSDEGPKGLGGNEIELSTVKYFRAMKSGPEIALVEIYWTSWGGSSSQNCHLLIFRVDGEQLVETQQLDFDTQAAGTGTDLDFADGVLTIRARANDESPHCCPKLLDIVKFKWTGIRFSQISDQKVPVKGR